MSVLANCSILSVGMGMAFPSVSIQAMTNATDYMSLEEHEFSWFGKCTIHYSFKNRCPCRYNGTVCLSSGNRTAPVKHVCLSAASNWCAVSIGSHNKTVIDRICEQANMLIFPKAALSRFICLAHWFHTQLQLAHLTEGNNANNMQWLIYIYYRLSNNICMHERVWWR